MTFPAWPPLHPFPESQREPSPGAGPAFPGSSGGREQGKFRPGDRPYLTTVAVANDDGSPVGLGLAETLSELLLYQRAMVLGLSLITGVDLLDEVVRQSE